MLHLKKWTTKTVFEIIRWVAKFGMLDFTGADSLNRTGDLLITNQLLYQLSYVGVVKRANCIEVLKKLKLC